MTIQIEAKEISKSFGKLDVLKNVKLAVSQDEIFGIIGESGSGKTTLLNIIVGFMDSDSGKVLFESKPMSKPIKNIIGFATQENCVYNKLTVQENLNYFGKLYSLTDKQIKENSESILKLVELYDYKNMLAEHLSGGMQRRLNIACALIHNPKILILDEPTEDLDPILREEIIMLIKKINSQKTTVIMTSHLLDEAERICDTIAVLHNGIVIASGSPHELIDTYSKSKEIVIKAKDADFSKVLNIIKSIKEDKIIQRREEEIVVYTNDSEDLFPKVVQKIDEAKLDLIKLELKKPSLYEVFEFLVKKVQLKQIKQDEKLNEQKIVLPKEEVAK
ncbi:ABC transporter ATP-binding protein [Candidatus Woesearchaeota archaeon]|nr:ABC transporter ATP-binding protein [Candidatus Woesearchaeota archaeon]